MARKMPNAPETISLIDFGRKNLFRRATFRDLKLRYSSKESIAKILIVLRSHARLTQAQVAKRAGWRKAYVSRLESPYGEIPNSATLSHFAEACGMQTAVIFGTQTPDGLDVVTGTTINIIDPETMDRKNVEKQHLTFSTDKIK